MDLYGAMQPILDALVEERMAAREEVYRPPGIGPPEEPEPIKLAIIGQPNVVRAGCPPAGMWVHRAVSKALGLSFKLTLACRQSHAHPRCQV